MRDTILAQREWQNDYDKAVALGNAPSGYGQVVKYFGDVDKMGDTLIIVEFADGRKLNPYFNQFPEPQEITDIETDAVEWADNMSGATEWYNWKWEVF